MKLAILFWCYKHPDLCRDRVELLRAHNPTAPIYVLFGGEEPDAPAFERALTDLVDDFWIHDQPPPPSLAGDEHGKTFRFGVFWKYSHGDLLISAWHRERGRELEWDSVVVVQWDMLIYGPIEEVFACLGEGQALFSGLRPVSEVSHRWIWASPSRPETWEAYQEFLGHVRERHGFEGDPLCCLAIVLAFPRAFLERYAEIERPELGFLEYRLPIYAQAFGTPLCRDHPFRPWWGAVEPFRPFSALRALPREIWAPTIAWNLLRPTGARVFHPYWHRAPRGALGWTAALLAAPFRIVGGALLGLWNRIRERTGTAGRFEPGMG
jgi:hypothetical protein